MLIAEAVALVVALWTLRTRIPLPTSWHTTSADLWSPDGVNWWVGNAATRAGVGPPVQDAPPLHVHPFTLESSQTVARIGPDAWALGRLEADRITWTGELPLKLDSQGIVAAAHRYDAALLATLGLARVVLESPVPVARTATVTHRTVYWRNLGSLALAAMVAGACLHGAWLAATRGSRAKRRAERLQADSRCIACGHSLMGIPRHLPCPECGRERT